MLAHHLRRWPSIKPGLVQRLVFAGLRSIAAGLVLLTAGGDYKPNKSHFPSEIDILKIQFTSNIFFTN